MKATIKQDNYASELSEKIKAVDVYSQMFKDLATQCAYKTQTTTLGEVRSLRSQEKESRRKVMQQIARSRSEASLQYLDTTNVVRAESENNQRSVQDLQDEVIQLRTDHANLQASLKSKSDRENAEIAALKGEIRKFLKEFHRSNERIDRRTNDSQYFVCFSGWY